MGDNKEIKYYILKEIFQKEGSGAEYVILIQRI